MQNAIQADFEPFNASGWSLGIVVSQFNKHITNKVLKGTLQRAKDYHIQAANIRIIPVAGSIEIPLALQALAKTGEYNALLAIGCVIRGETPHFDYVCKMVSEGVLRVQLDFSIPVAFSVLTCDTEAQALARVDLGSGHLDAALHLAKQIAVVE